MKSNVIRRVWAWIMVACMLFTMVPTGFAEDAVEAPAEPVVVTEPTPEPEPAPAPEVKEEPEAEEEPAPAEEPEAETPAAPEAEESAEPEAEEPEAEPEQSAPAADEPVISEEDDIVSAATVQSVAPSADVGIMTLKLAGPTCSVNPGGQHIWPATGIVIEPGDCATGKQKMEKFICEACGDYKYVQTANPHVWKEGEYGGYAMASAEKLEQLKGTEYEGREASKNNCGTDGFVVRECSKCGSIEPYVIPATNDHKVWNDIPATPATCLEPAQSAGKQCAECGLKKDVEPDGDPLQHDWELVEDLSTAPTCGKKGTQVYVCKRAECAGYNELTGFNNQGADGKVPSEAAELKKLFGKDDSDGTLTKQYGGRAYKIDEVDETPHGSKGYKTEIQERTCDEDAWSITTCLACNKEVNRENLYDLLSKDNPTEAAPYHHTGHNLKATPITADDYGEEDGKLWKDDPSGSLTDGTHKHKMVCQNPWCDTDLTKGGKQVYTQPTAVAGTVTSKHEAGADCKQVGKTVYTCAECGDSKPVDDKEADSSLHIWGWIPWDKDQGKYDESAAETAKCGATVTQMYGCIVCRGSYYALMPEADDRNTYQTAKEGEKLPHVWSKTAYDSATCWAKGVNYYVCLRDKCDVSPADWSDNDATNLTTFAAKGDTEAAAKDTIEADTAHYKADHAVKIVKEDVFTGPLPHTYAEPNIVDGEDTSVDTDCTLYVAPQCNKDGVLPYPCTNDTCKTKFQAKRDEATNSQHKFWNLVTVKQGPEYHDYVTPDQVYNKDWQTEATQNVLPPTCFRDGLVGAKLCKYCHNIDPANQGEVYEKAPGKHTFVAIAGEAPTCTKAGYVLMACSNPYCEGMPAGKDNGDADFVYEADTEFPSDFESIKTKKLDGVTGNLTDYYGRAAYLDKPEATGHKYDEAHNQHATSVGSTGITNWEEAKDATCTQGVRECVWCNTCEGWVWRDLYKETGLDIYKPLGHLYAKNEDGSFKWNGKPSEGEPLTSNTAPATVPTHKQTCQREDCDEDQESLGNEKKAFVNEVSCGTTKVADGGQEANCTLYAQTKWKCTVCGNTWYEVTGTTTVPGGHVYGDDYTKWIPVQERTCEKAGIYHRVCQFCGTPEKGYTTVAAGHTYNDGTNGTKDTPDGFYEYGKPDTPLQANKVDCSKGYIKYYYCTKNDKCSAYAEGHGKIMTKTVEPVDEETGKQHEIENMTACDTPTDKIGTEDNKAATCQEKGLQWYACKDPFCTVTKSKVLDKVDHSFTDVWDEDAGKCTIEAHNEADHIVPGSDINLLRAGVTLCKWCDAVQPGSGTTAQPEEGWEAGHKWLVIDEVEATCSAPTKFVAVCQNNNCGGYLLTDADAAKNTEDDFGATGTYTAEWANTNDKTHIGDGLTGNAVRLYVSAKPEGPHTPDYTLVPEGKFRVVPATCTENATSAIYCSVCQNVIDELSSDLYEDTLPIDPELAKEYKAKGHRFVTEDKTGDGWVYDDAAGSDANLPNIGTAPTGWTPDKGMTDVKEENRPTHSQTCLNGCGLGQKNVPCTIVRDNANDVPATCKVKGKLAYKCADGCGYAFTIDEPNGELSKEHTFYKEDGTFDKEADTTIVIRETTCAKSGIYKLICTECQAATTYATEEGGHIWAYQAAKSNKADCEKPGTAVYYCTRTGCTGKLTSDTDGNGITYATISDLSAGDNNGHCMKTVQTAVLHHDLSVKLTAEDGVLYNAHKDEITWAPCKGGDVVYRCANDGCTETEVRYEGPQEGAEHHFFYTAEDPETQGPGATAKVGDPIEGEPVPATHSKAGYLPFQCSICHADNPYVEPADIGQPALGHTFDTTKTDGSVELPQGADCTKGYTMKVYCTNADGKCDYDETITNTNDKSYASGMEPMTDAEGEPSTNKFKGHAYKYIDVAPKAEHTLPLAGDPIEADCVHNGGELMVCEVCGMEVEQTFIVDGVIVDPKLGHVWKKGEEDLPEAERSMEWKQEFDKDGNSYHYHVCVREGCTYATDGSGDPYKESIKCTPDGEGTPVGQTCAHGAGLQYTCSVCGNTWFVENEGSEPLAKDDPNIKKRESHDADKLTNIVIRQADCTQTGIVKTVCTVCNTQIEYKLVNRHHTFYDDEGNVRTGADLEANATLVPSKGTAPSCGVAGTKVYKCKVANCPGKQDYDGDDVDDTATPAEITVEAPATDTGHQVVNLLVTADEKFTYSICVICGQKLANIEPIDPTATCDQFTASHADMTAELQGTKLTAAQIEAAAKATWVVEPSDKNHTPKNMENKNPTCTQKGSKGGVICEVCDKVLTEPTEMQALKHTWDRDTFEHTPSNTDDPLNGWTVTTLATCTTKGEGKYTCTACQEAGNVKDKVEIPALGHDYITGVDEDGNPTYDATKGVAYEATCTEDGGVLYTCTRCTDGEGHTLKVADPVNKPKTGHSWEKPGFVTDTDVANLDVEHGWLLTGSNEKPTCTQEAKGMFICTNKKADGTTCDEISDEITVDALGHDWGDPVTEDADCTTPGTSTQTCQRGADCDGYKGEGDGKEDAWQATGENESGAAVRVQSDKALGHVFQRLGFEGPEDMNEDFDAETYSWKVDEKATCTDAGSGHYTCKECGTEMPAKSTPIPALTEDGQHTFVDGDTVTEADCETDKTVEQVCSLCGAKGEPKTVPETATGHHFDYEDMPALAEGDIIHAHIGTCDNKGCHYGEQGTAKTEIVELKASDAETVDTFTVVEHPATCAEGGYYSYECTVCGAKGDTEKGKPANHDYILSVAEDGTITYDENKGQVTTEADCQTKKVTLYTCTSCPEGTEGHTLEVVGEVDATKHDFTLPVEAKAATCVEPGQSAGKKCSRCGEMDEDAKVPVPADPVNGHNYVLSVGEDGAITYDSTKGKVTTEADCSTKEVITYTCTREGCNAETANHEKAVEGEVNPEKHVYPEGDAGKIEANYHEATCTEGGYWDIPCTKNPEHKKQRVDNSAADPAKGDAHEWTEGQTMTSGTATVTYRYCKICGTVEITSIDHPDQLAADFSCEQVTHGDKHADHKLKDGTKQDATCTEAGHEAGQVCEYCKYTVGQTEIPAKGHDYVESTAEDGAITYKADAKKTETAPTCTADGYYVYECQSCTDETQGHFSAQVPSGKAKTGHSFEAEGFLEDVANRTTEKGWVVGKAPTCTKAGDGYFTCTNKNCGAEPAKSATQTVDALGHTWEREGFNDKDFTEANGWEVDMPADCVDEGEGHFNCTQDGCDAPEDNKSDPVIIEVDSTNHKNAQSKEKVDATCTTAGTEAGEYCDACEKWVNGGAEIPAKKHTWERTTFQHTPSNDPDEDAGWTVQTKATCDQPGSGAYTCLDCHEAGNTKTDVEIPQLNKDGLHSWERDDFVEPTDKNTADPTKGWVVDQPATEDAAGEGHYVCTDCGEESETKTIPQLQSSFQEYTKELVEDGTLRAEASRSTILENLPKGTQVTITGELVNGYYPARTQSGTNGFIKQNYIDG